VPYLGNAVGEDGSACFGYSDWACGRDNAELHDGKRRYLESFSQSKERRWRRHGEHTVSR